MSKKLTPQCGHSTSERPYIDPIPFTSHREEHQRQPYQMQEPPRFLFPDNQGYDPTILSRPSGYGPPSYGKTQDRMADARYTIASNAASSLAPYGVQRANPWISQQYPVDRSGVRAFPSSFSDASNSTLSYGIGSDRRDSAGSDRRLQDVDSLSSKTFPSPTHSDMSTTTYTHGPALTKQQQHSVPLGFDRILHHSSDIAPPPLLRPSTSSRYYLHVRQQPMAARACGAGDRDRRPVDPPPIVQMLLTDFDPHSQDDRDILQDPRFTVGCLLYPVTNPLPSHVPGESGAWEKQADDDRSAQLLSGKAFISPFFVEEDPDPSTAPVHPMSAGYAASMARTPQRMRSAGPPATFFIFADLSVRAAGLYRLQFRLMNWGSVEDTGQSMPILAETWSDPFRVYPAKDFPGMQNSSLLAEGLKELGFVELKTRGKGKGKGRRRSKDDAVA